MGARSEENRFGRVGAENGEGMTREDGRHGVLSAIRSSLRRMWSVSRTIFFARNVRNGRGYHEERAQEIFHVTSLLIDPFQVF